MQIWFYTEQSGSVLFELKKHATRNGNYGYIVDSRFCIPAMLYRIFSQKHKKFLSLLTNLVYPRYCVRIGRSQRGIIYRELYALKFGEWFTDPDILLISKAL
jgi:hypothetical protein